jgi:hypothetical protein
VRIFLHRKEVYHEGEIFRKAYVRKVQGHQEKGFDQNYLRESEAQAETGLIRQTVQSRIANDPNKQGSIPGNVLFY